MSVARVLSTLVFHPGTINPEDIARCEPRELAAMAEQQQVVTLALRGMAQAGGAIAAHLADMQEAARRWTLYEALQRRAVADLLDRVGTRPLLFFKGASLAYSVYDTPADRMRLDWDLLVRDNDVNAVEDALASSGFVKDLKKPGRIRVRQRSYRRPLADGECTIDLHTGIVNAPALARRVTFEDLAVRAAPLARLHPAARGLCDVDALILSVVHRLVHHPGEGRLIWDVDVLQLLARVRATMPALVERAAAWGAGPLVAYEISGVVSRSGRTLAPDVASAIGTLAAQPSDVGMFTREDRSRGDDFALDWRALGWRDRAALVRETFVPDPGFVRAASGSRLPLPLLYLRRLAVGAAAWFRRPSRRAAPDPRRPGR